MPFFHLHIIRHVFHSLLGVSLTLAKCFLVGQEVGYKLIPLLVHHSSIIKQLFVYVS